MYTIKIMILVLSLVVLLSCGGGSSNKNIQENNGVLKQTGQTQSYDTNGSLVSNGALRDDGYYQRGVQPYYTRSEQTQIVTDHATGLEWEDTPEVLETKDWLGEEAYSKCHDEYNNPRCPDEGCNICYDTSGDTAVKYCASLALDGGGWRLPSVEELFSIVDKVKSNPSIDSIFQNIDTQSRYYTSTIIKTFLPVTIDFQEGYSLIDFPKLSPFQANVRCVRGENVQREFERTAQDTVVDKVSNLEWQDDYVMNDNQVKQSSWQEAIVYCESLELNGSRWRLPNIHELYTLFDHKGEIDEHFSIQEMTSSFWSSTTYSGSMGGALPGDDRGTNTKAWVINYTDFYYSNGEDKNSLNSVRCVRDYLK